MSTFVVTGASSGLGLELTRQLAARGDKVYATVRKPSSSASGVDSISEIAATGDVKIIEGIDMTDDNVGAALAKALEGVTIDCLIHNAGSVNGTREVSSDDIFAEQKLPKISMDRMRAAFEVNTLGPLKMTQALVSQMKSPGGKIAIMSTGMGSIGDNSSGGLYAYRSSKAAVNMVAKSLSCDLKEQGICVTAIAPGFVATEFGPGLEGMTKMGGAKVEDGVKGCLDVIDAMSMENTGSFMRGNYGKGPIPMEW